MSTGRFPGSYVKDTPAEGSDRMMEYVPFENMGIGARASGKPKGTINGSGSLEHVGRTTGGGKK